MLELIRNSPLETRQLGVFLGQRLQKGDVIGLMGDLGAGKTVFVQGLAEGLKVKDYVTSPTFTLINQYEGVLPLYHFDVYRLDDSQEFLELGYEEYFYGEGVTVIEWAEKIKDFLPDCYLALYLFRREEERVSSESRRLVFKPHSKRWIQVVEELRDYAGSGD